MCITEAEREVLRKNVKNMIPQFKKTEIVNHLKKEGYKERTIYNTIERMEDEGSLNDNLRTGRPPVLDTHHRKLREFDLKCVESFMRGVKAKVKSIGQHGVFSLFKK